MGDKTGIEWCDHTFNPWWGCTKVSEGCNNCYAEAMDKRLGGGHWGKGSPRREFGARHWDEPRRWDDAARKAGVRRRVFCASMADVFDAEVPDSWRDVLWLLIEKTPHLDWLMLTKRPQNHEMVPTAWQTGTRRPANVWLGVTAENQARANERIPTLLRAPWPAVRFVSYEPALGPIDLTSYLGNHVGYEYRPGVSVQPDALTVVPGISWVIAGAESGRGARQMSEDWVRDIRDQCAAAGVAFFYKQRIERGRKVTLPVLDGRQHVEWPNASA